MTNIQNIALGGGCFWCMEAVFQRVEGVTEVESGYAGGQTLNPTYKEVCSGNTGHAEVVSVDFDSRITTLTEILDIFWQMHNPTTLNRQGADRGTQYRSIILWTEESQLTIIQDSIQQLALSGKYLDPIVTEVIGLNKFYPAEAEHRDYYNLNSETGYCQVVISPKLKKLSGIKTKK